MKDEVIEDSIVNLFKSLPPAVADRVREKYEADRAEFLRFVEAQDVPKDSTYWAKDSCTKCNGRGILGTLVKPSGEEVLPVCSCVAKNYSKWLVEQRKVYNSLKEQGHEKIAD